jgi:hypothetical protein
MPMQTVESNIQSDSPSVQLQTCNEIEVHPEPEVASTEPQVMGDPVPTVMRSSANSGSTRRST